MLMSRCSVWLVKASFHEDRGQICFCVLCGFFVDFLPKTGKNPQMDFSGALGGAEVERTLDIGWY